MISKERQNELIEEATSAFYAAEEGGYISKYSSREEIEDNKYEIMEFSDLNVDDITDEEWKVIEKILLGLRG